MKPSLTVLHGAHSDPSRFDWVSKQHAKSLLLTVHSFHIIPFLMPHVITCYHLPKACNVMASYHVILRLIIRRNYKRDVATLSTQSLPTCLCPPGKGVVHLVQQWNLTFSRVNVFVLRCTVHTFVRPTL